MQELPLNGVDLGAGLEGGHANTPQPHARAMQDALGQRAQAVHFPVPSAVRPLNPKP